MSQLTPFPRENWQTSVSWTTPWFLIVKLTGPYQVLIRPPLSDSGIPWRYRNTPLFSLFNKRLLWVIFVKLGNIYDFYSFIRLVSRAILWISEIFYILKHVGNSSVGISGKSIDIRPVVYEFCTNRYIDRCTQQFSYWFMCRREVSNNNEEIEVLSHETYQLTCDNKINKTRNVLQLYLWMYTAHPKRIRLMNKYKLDFSRWCSRSLTGKKMRWYPSHNKYLLKYMFRVSSISVGSNTSCYIILPLWYRAPTLSALAYSRWPKTSTCAPGEQYWRSA